MHEGEWVLKNHTASWIENLLPEDHFMRAYDSLHQPILYTAPYNWVIPIVSVSLYILMVFFLPRFIKKGFDLKWPLAFWNLFLSVTSGVLLVPWFLCVLNEFIVSGYSPHHIICMPYGELARGLPIFLGSTYGCLKIFEFGDTLFLILRKREVNFLHWYHHSTVLLYAWYCLMVLFPVANIFGLINATVHTIMYGYYFLSSIGSRPWWGKYVTKLQIVQMVIGLISAGVWTYWYVTGQNCRLFVNAAKRDELGNEQVLIVASALLYGSYFFLFLRLYIQRFVHGDVKQRVPKEDNSNEGTATKSETKKDQ